MTPEAPSASALDRLSRSRLHIAVALAQPVPALAPLPAMASELLQAATGPHAWEAVAHWAGTRLVKRWLEPVRQAPLRSLGLALGAGMLLGLLRPWRWRVPTPLLLALFTQLALPWLGSRRPAPPPPPS